MINCSVTGQISVTEQAALVADIENSEEFNWELASFDDLRSEVQMMEEMIDFIYD